MIKTQSVLVKKLKMCKICFVEELKREYIPSHFRSDLEAIKWLGLKPNQVCCTCKEYMITSAERLTESFYRPLDVMLNSWQRVPYKEIPKEIKVLGWALFLQDRLRDMTFGHYWRKRFFKVNNPNGELP